jgi:trehalose synthase
VPGTGQRRGDVGALREIDLDPLPFDRFRSVLDPDRYREYADRWHDAKELLGDRVVWQINSTGTGGGVAEMLASLVRYALGAEIEARWLVIAGDDDFFRITKRIHNRLHGVPGDEGPLEDTERESYESTLQRNADDLKGVIRAGDVVLLHDPQTAGLAPSLREAGAEVVWRCHIGIDEPNDLVRGAWEFLRPYLEDARASVFSRREYVWEGLDGARVAVIAPSIDAFSLKNQDLHDDVARAILAAAGVCPSSDGVEPRFERGNGSDATVQHRAEMIEDEPVPSDALLVAQVSRWDRLKDPVGVVRGFGEHVDSEGVHLVVAGPETASVTDDPEGADTVRAVRDAREALPPAARRRVHLACLPSEDHEENAVVVNSLQRRADVVVQKSLAEGFGLTVAEAMWKGRPVVASRVGGIQDQIEDGTSGVLVDDPADLRSFGLALQGVLDDPRRAGEMGLQARLRVRDHFLTPRHLEELVGLAERVLG